MLSLLAAVLLSQCASGISDNAQTMCGHKTWTDAQTFESQIDIQADSVVRGNLLFLGPGGGLLVQVDEDRNFQIVGSVSSEDLVSADVNLSSTHLRYGNAPIATVYNGSAHTYRPFAVTADGKVHSGSGPNPDGGRILNGGFMADAPGNGAADYGVAAGAYLTIMGSLPQGYAQPHAAVTVENAGSVVGQSGMTAGYLFGVINPVTPGGNILDNKFYINYRGSIEPIHEPVSTFEPCGNYTVLPADGGDIGTDAGVAQGGAIRYGSDTHRWYLCVAGEDGGVFGAWKRILTEDDLPPP